MIQIYATGWRTATGAVSNQRELIYDSRLQDEAEALLELKVTKALNKGGTATFTLTPAHPFFGRLLNQRTVIEILRDNDLIFRGRVLYPSDTFDLLRTFTCEGERCFLNDAPLTEVLLCFDEETGELLTGTAQGVGYLYQASPEAIFRDVVDNRYDYWVDSSKRFTIGTIDVTDKNDYIRLESSEAESVATVIDKLVERCGGYIIFDDDENGKRRINWRAEIVRPSTQAITFGDNLLDFSRTTANTDLATVIVPYGAVLDEETGARLTIKDVNGGLSYIEADSTVLALRGRIARVVTWDDVTEPANLLKKAEAYLAECSQMLTTLELTALDLSSIDKTVSSFQLGDKIKVYSRPHGLDGAEYQLTELTLDLLNPQNDKITLGKTVASLTGSDVVSTQAASNRLQKVGSLARAAYHVNSPEALTQLAAEMRTLIEQTADALRLEVSESYASDGDVEAAISTSMTQLADSWEFLFSELRATVEANDASARDHYEEQLKYIRFEDGNIILGENGNEVTLRIENDRISFLSAGAEVAYFSNNQLTVLDGTFLNSLRIGRFAFLPRANGNLSLVKVGD